MSNKQLKKKIRRAKLKMIKKAKSNYLIVIRQMKNKVKRTKSCIS